ncbi:hypothetical protein BJ742DRAFT_268074 [Cladochytrium replicatum]|nr:hypothetical protein BJ742DRAFT_268074 [Cladochytrium replicatum]
MQLLTRRTWFSPFYLAFALQPCMVPHLQPTHMPETCNSGHDLAEVILMNMQKAQRLMKTVQERQSKYYDDIHMPAPHYDMGDSVMIDHSTVNSAEDVNRPVKLRARWLGPFRVTATQFPNVTVELPVAIPAHPTFRVSNCVRKIGNQSR